MSHKIVLVAAIVCVVVLAIGLALSNVLASAAATLQPQAAAIPDVDKRVAALNALLQYQTDNQIKIWSTLLQGLGGTVLAVGAYFAWRNLRLAQETLTATQQRLTVDREAQITNRFTQAVDQLGSQRTDGSPAVEVRVGGIYALARIARDSPSDHWPIMEVLTAYVRSNQPWVHGATVPSAEDKPILRSDLQAVLTTIRRRMRSPEYVEMSYLDLRNSDLSGGDLREAPLEQARFYGANLSWGFFGGATLRGARFDGASLEKAFFDDADLSSASLVEVSLRNARLERSNLTGANFRKADLAFADLKGANLLDANLETAHLYWTYLGVEAEVRSRAKLGKVRWEDSFRVSTV